MSLIHKIWKSKLWFLITVVILFFVNWLASIYHGRLDLTNEKRFTLSSSTKKLLRGLDSVVEIKVLLAGDIKSEFKKLAVSAKDVLESFKDINPKFIRFKFELPAEGLDDSAKSIVYDSLVYMGIRPTNQQVQSKEGEGTNQQQIFPGAVITYGDRSVGVDLLQGQVQKNVFNSGDILDKQSLNSAEALLEYKFANAILVGLMH